METSEAEKEGVEPVAFLHIMHQEGGQTMERLSFGEDDLPFGVPGEDHDLEYEVTVHPLYLRPSPAKQEG